MKLEDDSLGVNEEDEEEMRLINQNSDLEKEYAMLK